MGVKDTVKRGNISEGVVMIATGEKHYLEAFNTARRLRPFLEGRPITLVTNIAEEKGLCVFDEIIAHTNAQQTYRDKIEPLKALPYKRTILLDTDIELVAPIGDMFELLKHFDLLGSHAPVRWCQWKDPDVPEGFCELNSGVLGIRQSWKQRRWAAKWLETYDKVGVPYDQASLRSATWWACRRHGLKVWVLPCEYNLRTPKPWLTGAQMAVKIIHGRLPDHERQALTNYLNSDISGFRSSEIHPTGQNELVIDHHPQSKP